MPEVSLVKKSSNEVAPNAESDLPPWAFEAEEVSPEKGTKSEQIEDTFECQDTVASDDNFISDDEDEDGHAGHGEKPKSILTAFASAIINFLLMFGLCCAYGMIMFEHNWNSRHRGMAVKMNLATAFLVGLMLAVFSKVPVAIGGPDLNPVVFLGMFTTTLAEELAKKNSLVYPDSGSRRLLEQCDILDPASFLRRLGGSDDGDVEFCTGYHYKNHAEDCDNYHAQLLSTTVFTVAVASSILSLLFLGLGKFRLTRLVAYVPINIMEAFLSCVGYKVFKYALSFCNYEPKQFLPAACIGVPLYFVKALHIGNPAIVIPVMLLVPLGIFYGILFASGSDIASARKDGWFFAEIENADFYAVWKDGLTPFSDDASFGGNISFSAWAKTLGDLPIMLIVCLLDCLLKLSSTESKLPVKADKDYEIQLYGVSNILTALSGSSVGYMQLKFNVINYGVMGNVADRRGGILYALFCGACFFWTTDLFNYLPRFFLSTLLFFAGSGFVAENLWGSRKYLSLQEWLQIFFILAVFIITGSLLYAVIIGGLVVGASFIMRQAKVPIVQAPPLKGGQVVCTQRQPPLMEFNIRHIANSNVMVIRLKGFIFFASAQQMTEWVNKIFEHEREHELPHYRRLRWLIFDCDQLDGLDSSASKCLAKLAKSAHALDVRMVWSTMSQQFRSSLEKCGTIRDERDWFDTLDNAMQHVQHKIYEKIILNHCRWGDMHPLFKAVRGQIYDRVDFDPFSRILSLDEQRFGCPWAYCGRLPIKAYETILWKPGTSNDLFLIHSGEIALFETLPDTNGDELVLKASEKIGDNQWGNPQAVYTRGWFVNRQALFNCPSRSCAVAMRDGEVLFWNELQWARMRRERPRMADAIMKAVLSQESKDGDSIELDKNSLFGKDMIGDGGWHFGQIKIETGESSLTMKKDAEVSYELRGELQGLAIARACEELGLYNPVDASEEAAFEALPCVINEDIELAFTTYAEQITESTDSLSLPREKLADALKFAGIYDATLKKDIGKEHLTKTEFAKVCRRALLAPMSSSSASKLRQLFLAGCKNELKTMGCSDLIILLKEIFKTDITAEDVDGMANLWCARHGNGIGEEAFLAIMARFVSRHMKDWLILKGVREMMGEDAFNTSKTINADMLVKARPDLTREMAEEMIWSADYCAGMRKDNGLDFRMIGAILRNAPSRPRELPEGKSDRLGWTYGQETSKVDFGEVAVENISFVEVAVHDNWLRDILVDVRSVGADELKEVGAVHTWGRRASIVSKAIEHKKVSADITTIEVAEYPQTFAAKVFLLLEYPESSRLANWVSLCMGVLIMISVFTLFLEPLTSPKNKSISDTEKTVWFVLEAIFTTLFTIEFLLKFITCTAIGTKTRMQFLKEPMNICDLVAILPFYIDITIDTDQEEFRLFRIARLMRLSRLVRLGRLAKRSATFAPIAMILVVIWGIYMKNGLKEK